MSSTLNRLSGFLSSTLLVALLVATAGGVEVRGPVAEVLEGATYCWTAQDFGGFFYDLDDDIGGERLSLAISGGRVNVSEAVYTSTAEEEAFEFSRWGSRMTIGFLGEDRFAGYCRGYLQNESGKGSLFRDDEIAKVLLDDDGERTIESGLPLRLEEGYSLQVVEVDAGEKVSLALLRDGASVDSGVVEPSKENGTVGDGTYLYRRQIGGEDFVFIAVHFKNVFSSGGDAFATIDGIWQISEETVPIGEGDEWGEMTVTDLDPDNMTLTMKNEGREIGLVRGRSRLLMGDIGIKTADQDDVNDSVNAAFGQPETPLRFCIYRTIEGQEPIEIRGRDGEVVDGSIWVWNSTSFAGFYYDMDEGVGDESLVLNVTGDLLEEGTGAVYSTSAQKKGMEFEGWGAQWTIPLFGTVRFAGYADGLLREESESPNMLEEEQLVRVLIDDDRRETFDTDSPLGLEGGYKLSLESVDEGGEKVSLALFKDGALMDSQVMEPWKSGSTLRDETYIYSRSVGGADDLVVIAVHFKSAFATDDDGFAEVDGIWQISDMPEFVEEGDEYGEMTVTLVDPDEMMITMANDEAVLLTPDDEINLFGDIWIRTADQDANNSINLTSGLPEDPLRFYVFASGEEGS